MKEKELRYKVREYFEEKGFVVEEEVWFDMTIPEKATHSRFLRVFRIDLLVTTPHKAQIGVECKTVKDAFDFRKILTGLGQSFLYARIFGWSFLALEVNEEWLENRREMFKRVWLTNPSRELGFGVLFIREDVVQIELPLFRQPLADTHFMRTKTNEGKCWRCNMEESILINIEKPPFKICRPCYDARLWYDQFSEDWQKLT